jgi:hypothetical protein
MKIYKMNTDIKKLYSLSEDKREKSSDDRKSILPVDRKRSDIIEISPEARKAFVEKKKREEFRKEESYLKWLFVNSDRIAGRSPEDPFSMYGVSTAHDRELALHFLVDMLVS